MGDGVFELLVREKLCCESRLPVSALHRQAVEQVCARRQAEDAATAGNGRLARNKLEQAILNQSRRLVAEPNAPLDLLLWTDFELEE